MGFYQIGVQQLLSAVNCLNIVFVVLPVQQALSPLISFLKFVILVKASVTEPKTIQMLNGFCIYCSLAAVPTKEE